MKWLMKFVIVLIVLIPVSVLGGVYLAIEDRPLIEREVQLNPDEIQRAKHLFQEHDPRTLQDGMIKTMTVNQQDLSLALNYLVNLLGKGGARVTITDGHLATQATLQIPKSPLGKFLNVDVEIAQSTHDPRFKHLRIGQLPIPSWLAEQGLEMGLNQAYAASNVPKASEVIHAIALKNNQLHVTYQWDSKITDVVRNALVSQDDRQRLKAYHEKLTEVTHNIGPKVRVSLSQFLPPLFTLAQDRSKTNDAVAENRAVIVLLSTYINHRGLKRMVPEAEEWPQPIYHTVTLYDRRDFPQHFIISAAVSMAGGNLISNAIGVFKEVEDSRGGSGFSFSDLGADKAGTILGQRLTSSQHAGQLQERLARPLREEDLMPMVKDLPEGLSEAEFAQQFGNVDSPRYNQVVAQIDQRVAALNLYQ